MSDWNVLSSDPPSRRHPLTRRVTVLGRAKFCSAFPSARRSSPIVVRSPRSVVCAESGCVFGHFFLRNVHPIIQVDPWAILATILWGVHSVAIFFFVFSWKFRLPIGLHSSSMQYQPKGQVKMLYKISRLSGCPTVYMCPKSGAPCTRPMPGNH